MGKTGTGSKKGTKVKKGCSISKISIREKVDDAERSTVVYSPEEKIHSTKRYIFISGKSKSMSVDTEFKKLPECHNGEKHGKFEITQNGKKKKVDNGAKADIFYDYALPVNLPKWKDYMSLSDSSKQTAFIQIASCCGWKKVFFDIYPDVQWALAFSFGTESPIAIKWNEWKRGDIAYVPPKAQSTAGKIGADARYGKNCSFKFQFKAKYDNGKIELSLNSEYEKRIKSFSDLLEKFKNPMDIIGKKTKGSIPAKITCLSPSVSLKAQWQYAKDKTSTKIGKKVGISFSAEPILGIEATIDLLGAGIYGVNPGAYQAYTKVKELLNKSKYVKGDFFIDLILSGKINGGISTDLAIIENEDTPLKVEANLDAVISIEIKAGARIKGKVTLYHFEAEIEGKAEAAGSAKMLFGNKIEYKSKKLIYRPKAIFQGLIANFVLYGSAKGGCKLFNFKGEVNYKKKYTIVPEFDFVKEVENFFNVSADFTILDNQK